MTKTAQELEQITDEGRFEELAAAVLRRARPEYRGLNDTGRNVQGRTIKSPVDGVYRIPGSSPSHYVIVQHTTAKPDELRRKWLNEKDGDVTKALRWAEEQRQKEPGARVTLVLTSNRRVPENLITDVGRACSQGGVEEDLWSVFRLQEFLDLDPGGQRIRQHYLGIEQELLDEDLLRELGERSCRLYAERELFGASLEERVSRSLDPDLRKFVMEGRNGAVAFLVAGSGHGKTNAAHHLLREHLSAGGFGLWLEPDIIQAAPTVEAAIEKTLRGLYPQIETGCGSAAIGLARRHGGLLLVADDVNRTSSPARLVQKIAGWNGQRRSDASNEAASGGSEGYRVLCPVWPQVVGQVPDQAEKVIRDLCLYAGPFSPEEGAAALRRRARATGMELTDLQARELSERLGHDPLLISFWSEDSMGEGPAPVSARVIERFIQKRMAELSRSDPASGLAEEYEGTLLSLSYRLLEARELRPTWSQLASWMGDPPGELSRLRRLADQREVIRLEPSAQGPRLAFRHDRVRDHLLARAFHRSMTAGEIPDALLADPYYAEVLGQALLLGDLDPTWASRIGHANPLALFYALRVFQRPATPMERAILEAMRHWIREEVVTNRCVMPLRESVDRILAETDSPHALELTEDFPLPWPALWEARMRNGDVEAGARYSYWLGIHFVSTRMDLLIRHAEETFGDRFVRDLAALLERSHLPEELRIGALYLAGHLGAPKLAAAIARNWEEGCSSVDVLRAFLWAGLRCCSDPAPLLDPMLEFWGNLSDDKREKQIWSDRLAVSAHGLTDGVARVGISDAAVPYLLTRVSTQDNPLAWPMFVIVRRLDHPDALEFCLRDKRGWDLSHYWNPRSFGGTAVVRSRDRLRQIWEKGTEDSNVRERAFELWSLGSNEEEIETFRAIGPGSLLYEQALRKRVDLGDWSCAPEIVSEIENGEHPWTWWFHCERIWSEPLQEILEKHFEQRGRQLEGVRRWETAEEDWETSRLLARISPLEAEEILIRYWAYLRYSPRFVQVALYLGTSRLRDLAGETIRECPEPKKLFEFIHHREFAQDYKKSGLSLKRLESLAPYLHLFDEQAIDWLWHACNLQGFTSWRREHVDCLVSEKSRKRLGVTDRDLVAELDDFATAKRSRGFVGHWLEGFQQRGDPEGKAMRIVASWLQERGTFEALKVAADCVALGGTRQDLALLETTSLPTDDPRVTSLLAATRFRVFRRSLS